MTLIYVCLILNFIFLIGSWVFFFKIFRLKDMNTCFEIQEIREDLKLVTKNPAAARRKLKSTE